MNAELFAALLFAVMNLISSSPVSNKHNRDNCIFKDGEKVPTFIYQLSGDQYVQILCSKDTCHCDGSNTGYKGCQSCCCAMRQKNEGNEKTNKIHSQFNPFFLSKVTACQPEILLKNVSIMGVAIGM